MTGAPPAKPGAVAGSFALTRSLIIPRHRHLKWRALDPLEAGLMILCGVCIGGFSLCVFLDVLTRTIGHPWLWLQQATTAFFAWGVFVGMLLQHDHRHPRAGQEEREHQAGGAAPGDAAAGGDGGHAPIRRSLAI